jgi:hypothetical protein
MLNASNGRSRSALVKKKNMKTIRCSLILILLTFIALPSYAETNAQVWGDITTISQNEFVIDRGAMSDGSFIKISLEITKDTTFKGVKSLKDLASGDFVIVEYSPSNRENVGTAIKITAAGKLEAQRTKGLSNRDSSEELQALKADVKRIKEKLGMD